MAHTLVLNRADYGVDDEVMRKVVREICTGENVSRVGGRHGMADVQVPVVCGCVGCCFVVR